MRRHGWTTWYAASLVVLARQRVWTGPAGRRRGGRAHGRRHDLRGGRQLYLPSATCVLVRALLERDDAAGAAGGAGGLDAAAPSVGPFAAWREESRGLLAVHRGDHEAALEAYLACGARAGDALGHQPGAVPLALAGRAGAARLGRAEQARALIAEERARARALRRARAIGVALRAAGACWSAASAAVELLREAAARHAACGAHVEHARTLCELGGAIRRAGRPVEARGVLREAIRAGRLHRRRGDRPAAPGRSWRSPAATRRRAPTAAAS